MTDAELRVLHQAAIKLGIPTTELSVRNPFEMKGKRAEMLQAAIAEVDPVQAAAWNRDAGGELSLACQMAERGLIEHSSATKKELWQKSPNYVVQKMAADKKAEEDLMAKWENDAFTIGHHLSIHHHRPFHHPFLPILCHHSLA